MTEQPENLTGQPPAPIATVGQDTVLGPRADSTAPAPEGQAAPASETATDAAAPIGVLGQVAADQETAAPAQAAATFAAAEVPPAPGLSCAPDSAAAPDSSPDSAPVMPPVATGSASAPLPDTSAVPPIATGSASASFRGQAEFRSPGHWQSQWHSRFL